MTVKALPGSSLEVIEPEFFFQLLMSLLADPSRLDGGSQGAQVRRGRQVGEVVFENFKGSEGKNIREGLKKAAMREIKQTQAR